MNALGEEQNDQGTEVSFKLERYVCVNLVLGSVEH